MRPDLTGGQNVVLVPPAPLTRSVCMHIHRHSHTHTRTHTHTHIYIYIYIHTYTCTHTYAHTYTSKFASTFFVTPTYVRIHLPGTNVSRSRSLCTVTKSHAGSVSLATARRAVPTLPKLLARCSAGGWFTGGAKGLTSCINFWPCPGRSSLTKP